MNPELLKWMPWICKVLRWVTRIKPKRATVLIIEDYGDDAVVLERSLRRLGYDCEIAQSAEVAQGLLQNAFYSVIFVDMRLPGLSGEALLRVLSKGSPTAKLVVICGDPGDLRAVEPGEPIIFIKKSVNTEGLTKLFSMLKL